MKGHSVASPLGAFAHRVKKPAFGQILRHRHIQVLQPPGQQAPKQCLSEWLSALHPHRQDVPGPQLHLVNSEGWQGIHYSPQ